MKRFVLAAFALGLAGTGFAQTDSTKADNNQTAEVAPVKKKKDWSKVSLANRANDHFMFQFGYDGWLQVPDSIRTTGFGRHLNIYFMFDFPFKNDPRLSIGVGAGIGSSTIYFDKQGVNIAGLNVQQRTRLEFPDLSQKDHFKKFKLVNSYVEVPLEFRFVSNPENNLKTWKAALGVKVGALLNTHTKGKVLVDKDGKVINSYSQKQSSKTYFNGTRFAATARIGYGIVGLYGAYQLNNVIKDGAGPPVRPMSIGITLSGL